MIEKNTISYISPSKCMSRQQELAGSKPEKEIQLDASKTSLVVKEQAASTDISIASDLALFQAIQRRSLAMDLTGLATYEVMKKWTDRLFNIYSQSVARGFHKVSQAQLLRADRQAFVRLGELFTGLLKQGTGPGKALDPYIAFRVVLRHVLGSGDCPGSLMARHHCGVIGGRMVFHFLRGSIWFVSRLYSFMARLIPKLQNNNIVWTVENPWTSLLWRTSYWRRIEKLRP